MLSARRIPPPKKKPTSQPLEKTKLAISEKNVISFRITRSLPNTSLHYPNNLNHPKETSTPLKKHQPPPSPKIYTPLEQISTI